MKARLVALALLLASEAGAATSFTYSKAPRQPVQIVDASGNPANISADGHLEVAVHDPITAFGELAVAEYTPLIQHHFVYNNQISTENFAFFTNGGGSTSTANNMMVCNSGSQATFSVCTVRTGRSLVYHAGQGSMGRFTTLFSSSTPGVILFAGFGNAETAIGFTMNEYGNFGVVRSSGGLRQTMLMGLNTKSSNAQNATITLNGQTFTCAVTNGTDARVTANEISACDYTGKYPGWVTEAFGSSVTFIPTVPGPSTGTYSISFPTSGNGVFSTFTAGVNPVVEFVPQTQWNIDTLDGSASTSNPSGFRIDPQKLNVYGISYQYLGAGTITYFVESPGASGKEGEEILPVHRIAYAGREVTPSLSNPSMPFVISARNVGVAQDLSIKTASIGAFTQGPHMILGQQRSYSVEKTGIGTSYVPVLTVSNSLLFGNRINQSEMDIQSIQISNNGTKGAQIQVIENTALGNDRNWVYVSTETSPARADFSATSATNGIVRVSRGIPAGQQADIDMTRYRSLLRAGGKITIMVRALATTVDVLASVQWTEDQ